MKLKQKFCLASLTLVTIVFSALFEQSLVFGKDGASSNIEQILEDDWLASFATDCFSSFQPKHPRAWEKAEIFLKKARYFYHKKDYDRAIANYKKAIVVDPDEIEHTGTLIKIAQALQEKGDWKGAEDHYRQAIKRNPICYACQWLYLLLTRQKRLAEAEEVKKNWKAAHALEKEESWKVRDYEHPFGQLGGFRWYVMLPTYHLPIARQPGATEQEQKQKEKLEEEALERQEKLRHKITVLYNRREYEKCIALCRQHIAEDPTDSEFYKLLAKIFYDQHDPAAMESILKQAISNNYGQIWEYYTNLAELYFEQQRYKESAQAGLEALKACPHLDSQEQLKAAIAFVETKIK